MLLLMLFICHKNEVPAIWSSAWFFLFEFQQNKTKPKKWNGNQTWNQENQICECFKIRNEQKKNEKNRFKSFCFKNF